MSVSSGTIIREARRRAKLTQAELARRADVVQPVISAYETDTREPALSMLMKLIDAAGFELSLDLIPHDGELAQGGRQLGRLGRRLVARRNDVVDIASRRGATNVRVFGSVARGEEHDDSDIDLLVDLDQSVGLIALAGLTRELSELLGVAVDVVPADQLKDHVKLSALRDARPL